MTNSYIHLPMSEQNVAATPLAPSARDHLLSLARQAEARAYAPYSKFHVGAAILLTDGRTFTGCNVENASYGLTNCAERTAIFRAIAESDLPIRIAAVAVTNASNVHCPPCGACRQVIAEFSSPETQVFYQGASGTTTFLMRDLLPDSFRL